jgi:hypothetical protein
MTSSLYNIGDRIIHETWPSGVEYHKIYYIVANHEPDVLMLSSEPDGKPSHVVYKKVVGSQTFFKHLPRPVNHFDEEVFKII